MKPLYKFKITNKKKKERKRYQYPPSLTLSPIQGFLSWLGLCWGGHPSGLRVHTTVHIWRDPLTPQPPRWKRGGWTASGGEAETENSTDCSHESRQNNKCPSGQSLLIASLSSSPSSVYMWTLAARRDSEDGRPPTPYPPPTHKFVWVFFFSYGFRNNQLQTIPTRRNSPVLLFYS